MVRALLEGVLLNLRSILLLMQRPRLAFDAVRVPGGATASPLRLLAGVGTGHWSSLEQALGVIAETGRTRPRADATRVCGRLHPIHAKLHATLAATCAALAEAEPS